MKEQVQWVLTYIQAGSVDVWKKDLLENIEAKKVQFALVRDLLLELKRWTRKI